MGVMRDRKLTEHQRAMFRAGHAHAGVLLVLALVALQILSRTTLPDTTLWIACLLLLFGILAQSGGFFLHLLPNRGKLGGRVTSAGAVLLAAATLLTAYGVAFA
jgi:protein-S-isoprenylcysteine O-methyltransferase Ste14